MTQKRRRISSKVLLAAISLTLILGSAFTGSLAWFVDSAGMVKNVFTIGDIKAQFVSESGTQTAGASLDDSSPNNTGLPMIVPGSPIPLGDTTLVVSPESETCYLFAQIEGDIGALPSAVQVEGKAKAMTFEDYFRYTVADGWIRGDGISVEEGGSGLPDSVYYRVVEKEADEKSFKIIDNDELVPSNEITKEMLNSILESNDPTQYPTLALSAYAVQYIGGYSIPFTPAEAWAILSEAGE